MNTFSSRIPNVSRQGGSRVGSLGLLVTVQVMAVVVCALAMPQLVHAATFTVNSTLDDGDVNPGDGVCESADAPDVCTLRAAIEETNTLAGADTIRLLADTYVLTLGELQILDSLVLNGENPNSTIIDGDNRFRVFFISNAGTNPNPIVNMDSVTIQNGSSGGGGGIVISQGSTLALIRSIVKDNRASSDGGGIFNQGTLNINESTITGNGFPDRGGGGIINSGGTVTLEKSTVDNNTATGGGFRGGGGIENIGGTLTITNSTISGNRLTGGVSSRGGGIRNAGGATLNLTNVTIANNSVAAGTGNVVRRGGGIFNEVNSTVNLTNTIIGENRAPISPDCFGTLSSGGFNLIGNTGLVPSPTPPPPPACVIVPPDAPGDQVGTESSPINPRLEPLAFNGGTTETHPLLPDSPAIDAGDNAECPDTDQRLFTRPVDGDGDGTATCDIGAFEFGAQPAQPEVVNDFVTFDRLEDTFQTTTDPTGCPAGFVGKFSFEARLTNISSQALADLEVEVTTLTGGNLLQNAEGGPTGVGARLIVPQEDGFADGLLRPGEMVDVPFVMCLQAIEPFDLVVDVLGTVP